MCYLSKVSFKWKASIANASEKRVPKYDVNSHGQRSKFMRSRQRRNAPVTCILSFHFGHSARFASVNFPCRIQRDQVTSPINHNEMKFEILRIAYQNSI